MVKTTILDQISERDWENFLNENPEANFLQSWYWGEFYKSINHQIYRRVFYHGQKLAGVMLLVLETARRGRYLTVPGGPIIDWSNQEVVQFFLDEIKKIAQTERCVFVRVRPQLIQTSEVIKTFRQLGFRDAPMHLHAELTSQLDITKPEEELLQNMRKTTRYEIKKALNLGIKVISSEDDSLLKQFYNLQVETAKRQKFVPFGFDYLSRQFKLFNQVNKVLLYSAFLEKQLLAQAMVIFYGREAVYHYGASTEQGRKYPGAYLIQWEAIKEAKKRGLSRYNFWGVAPEGETSHRFHGVSVFKRGFGGQDVQYLPAQDLVINKIKYLVNLTVENVRKKRRGL